MPLEDDVSSLSAILLDEGYYSFLKSGVRIIDGLPILDTEYIIPFKAKAWLDLHERKLSGGQVDSKHIKKHKRDIISISGLLPANSRMQLPEAIHANLKEFVTANSDDSDKLRRIIDFYYLSEH